MLGIIPSYLPKEYVRSYRIFAFFLYLLFFVVLVYGALSFLFPYQRYQFDFSNPNATKNNLFEPYTTNFQFPENGKVASLDTLTLYANNPQVLEGGDITLVPSDSQENLSLEGSQITVQHGWSATFLPQGEMLTGSEKTIVEYQGSYYEQDSNTLRPFVSQQAAESYVPATEIQTISETLFNELTKSEELIGFRPGTFLAYADGVFFVTEDNLIRPFGSAEVLLRSGYTFDHVIQASGEEVGIYKRGKIILPGAFHLGGTLFYDVDTKTSFLLKENRLRPLTESYAQFLSEKNDQVSFSSKGNAKETNCILKKKFIQKGYECHFALQELENLGNDYQLSLMNSSSQEVGIQMITVGLQSSRENENARATLRSLWSRLLERIGLY